jgi:hypothetical protein
MISARHLYALYKPTQKDGIQNIGNGNEWTMSNAGRTTISIPFSIRDFFFCQTEKITRSTLP